MKFFLTTAFFILFVLASNAMAEELYSDKPHCANIKNQTASSKYLSIRTDFYKKPDGGKSSYEEILHLKPDQMQQVCVKGPFLPDYKVFLTIKSLFPLFDCKTKLQGEIDIRDRPIEGHDAKDIYATCVE